MYDLMQAYERVRWGCEMYDVKQEPHSLETIGKIKDKDHGLQQQLSHGGVTPKNAEESAA